MAGESYRINVTLDGEYGARLARLAQRAHVQEGTLARSLLTSAIEHADPNATNIVHLLDSIDGAWEDAQAGLAQARARETVELDEL